MNQIELSLYFWIGQKWGLIQRSLMILILYWHTTYTVLVQREMRAIARDSISRYDA